MFRSLRSADGSPRRLPSIVNAIWWLFRLAWKTNPILLVTLGAFVLVRSAATAGVALVARGLINAAIHASGPDGGDLGHLTPWLVAGFVLGAIEAVTPFVLGLGRTRLADDLSLEVTSMVLRHAAELDLATLEDPRHRDTIDRAQHEAQATFGRLIGELEGLLSGILQIVLLSAVLVHVEPLVLFVVVPVTLPYLFFLWARVMRGHRRELMQQQRRRWTRYFASLLTGGRDVSEVRLLGIGAYLLDQCRALMEKLRDEGRRIAYRTFARGTVFTLTGTVAVYAVFVLVVAKVVAGELTVGDVAVFAAASPRLRGLLDRTMLSLRIVLDEGLMLAQTLAFLRIQPRIVSGSGPVPTVSSGELVLEDVWFTYPRGGRTVLSGISLTLKRGEIVGIVGPNGAGKTTLVKLIARLYDPDRGRILLDGMDLRQWPLAELHRRIALVCQDVPHLNVTAADNIAFGDWPQAAQKRAAIEEAAAAAGADEMIRLLPQGYDTLLGRTLGQHDLSGGQWQKLALARAFLRDAPFLILDEPTAHLDAASSNELQKRLRELASGRTTLLISHRRETVAIADRVVVVQQGRIRSGAGMPAPDGRGDR